MKNSNGFTLVEMMIVLFIVTVLLLITIPNAMSHHKSISEKGCEGLLNMVQAQVQAYWIDHQTEPTLDDLKEEKYIDSSEIKCPDGSQIDIVDGNVILNGLGKNDGK